MYKLYQMQDSGNCYKIRLLLSHLELPCEIVEVDITRGESRTPEFLSMNPNGKTPTLQLEDKSYLAESNAALWYLSQGTNYFPTDPVCGARALQWMFFEQYSHEPYIATSRYWITILGELDKYRQLIADRRDGGLSALRVMNEHLSNNDFFAGDYSIADIALYAYTHVADEGGFDLADYPAIDRWLERVQSQRGYLAMADPYPFQPL